MPGQQLFDWLYRLGLAGAMWDRDEPDETVTSWVAPLAPGARGRALDLGCGTGTHAMHLARCGYQVDAVDFSQPAVALADARARAAGHRIRYMRADVLAYEAEQPYDLTLDYGCFHSLEPAQWHAYARRVEALTAPGGRFILMAFSPRWPVDWRFMGPHHVPTWFVHGCFGSGFDIIDQGESRYYWEHVPALLRSLPGPYRARVYHMQRRR